MQNQQVANIIQATGHTTSSSAFNNNRFTSTQKQNQFYASSAPSSTAALNQARASSRPPVPLFPQSTGSVPHQGKMFSGNLPPRLSAASHSGSQPRPDLEDYTAFGGGYDMSRSASSSTNMGTISPSELLMSAPNSTALTALTSPSIYTPELSDNFDVSPSFEAADGWDHNPEHWPSLFPETVTGQGLVADASSALPDGVDTEHDAASQERRKSSDVSPKSSGRHSLVAGVNSRKRDKPLPPIVVDDPNDTVAVKRARNTLAARKSRERKAAKMEELEAEIARLEADRDYWKNQALAFGASGA